MGLISNNIISPLDLDKLNRKRKSFEIDEPVKKVQKIDRKRKSNEVEEGNQVPNIKKKKIEENRVDTLQAYNPADPHFLMNSGNKENVAGVENTQVTIRRGEDEYVVEKNDEETEKMKEVADLISQLSVREELDALIEKYKQKLEGYNDTQDFDRMAMEAQVLMMLYMRRDGANAQDLEQLAEKNVIVFQHEIKKQQDSSIQKGFAIASGTIIIVGSIAGAAGAFIGANNITNVALRQIAGTGKELGKLGSSVSGVGQGVQGLGGFWSNKATTEVTFLQTNQQLSNQKMSQNSEEKRRSLQAIITAINTIKEILRNRNQTVLVFAKGNQY